MKAPATRGPVKQLRFTHFGNDYRVDEKGRINANGIGYFSEQWIFLGGSRHHWRHGIDVCLAAAFENPASLNGCLGWDIDHGTTRTWGGRYNGEIPRISGAHVVEVKEEERHGT